MHKVVIASHNAGKLREIEHLLQPLGLEVLPQSAFGVPEADEPYSTFVENALAKARHACKATGLPALADDSGLCVDALNGAPGVHSARYAGEPKSDGRNNEKLVNAVQSQTDRKAHYYCVMVLMRHIEDACPIIAHGAWHGEIIMEPRGEGGFGYDPYFYLSSRDKTAAQLLLEEKSRISHRGKALKQLVAIIKDEIL